MSSRKAQFIKIAAEVFANDGYMETSIGAISKRVGLTGPALYRHFSSKQEVLDTICVSATEHSLQTMLDIQSDESLSPEEVLKAFIRARMDYAFSPDGLSYILAVSQKANLSENARERVEDLQQQVRAACAALLREVRPEATEAQIRFAIFAVQNLQIYMARRQKERRIMPDDGLKLLLEKMIWATMLA